jgi:succinyl-diaminopimelate desuccinylase
LDEVQLTERLIAFDTATPAGLGPALDFVEGWLEGCGARVERRVFGDRECVLARVGTGAQRVIFHGHLDVVPGRADQFRARTEGGRVYGRGAYDMKGALAAMMLATGDLAKGLDGTVIELVIVPDEERSEPGPNCTELLVTEGLRADFVICGEPTDMQVGVQAKGVLMLRAEVEGVAAHGSTPWLGQSAILAGVDRYRQIQDLPFAAGSTELFARPSINLGRIKGGDAINKVPDHCRLDIDVRYLPGQDPDDVLAQIQGLGDWTLEVLVERPPAYVDPSDPYVQLLLTAVGAYEPTATSVGRDGASDAVGFLAAGVPAIEFGPRGAGHHGPAEYVEAASLVSYRRALVDFARLVASRPVTTPAEVTAA